jgi:hypothetical protein
MNEREHRPYHERTLDQQTLDALLRIEEKLSNLNECLTAPRASPIEPVEPINQIEPVEPINTEPGGVTQARRVKRK